MSYEIPGQGGGGGGVTSVNGQMGAVTLTPEDVGAETGWGIRIVKANAVVSYATLSEAVDALVSGDTILLGPGNYPLPAKTLPANTRIEGDTRFGSAIQFSGTLTMGAFCQLSNLRLDCANGFFAVDMAGATCVLTNCTAVGLHPASTPIRMSADGGTILGQLGTNGVMTTLVTVDAVDCGIERIGVSGTSNISGFLVDVLANRSINVGSIRSLRSASIGGVFRLAAGANSTNSDILVGDNTTITAAGIHVTGDGASFKSIDAVFIAQDGAISFLVDPAVTTGTIVATGGIIPRDSISAPDVYLQQAGVNLDFFDFKEGNEEKVHYGGLSVGSIFSARPIFVGQGGPFTTNMVLLTEAAGGGVFTDVTEDLSLPNDETAGIFDSGIVDDAFYVGSPILPAGIEVRVDTALAGGSIVLEYLNSSDVWTPLNFMASEFIASDNDARQSCGQDVFSRVARENIRIDQPSSTAWTVKTINGSARYWMRYRITSGLTTPPILDQVQIIPDHIKMQSDGLEYFGHAVALRDMLWHRRLEDDLSGISPANQSLTMATGITLTPIDNRFNNGAIDGNGGLVSIPQGLDTSRPLLFRVLGYAANNLLGDVEIEFRYATLSDPDRRNGTIASTSLFEVQPTTGLSRTPMIFEFSFYVPDASPGDTLAIGYLRDATPGNLDDTYGANFIIETLELKGHFWR